MSVQNTEQWGVVELMGRRQVAGLISEVVKFGTSLMQIRIPQPDGSFVIQLVGGSAIYTLHYTSEATAREIAPQALVLIDRALPEPAERSDAEPASEADFDAGDDCE